MSDRGCSLEQLVGFLHYLADTMSDLNGIPQTSAKCPECGDTWSAWKPLCPSSPDYACGYRAVWKCENPECGEMELR